MSLRVTNLRLPVGAPETDLASVLAHRLSVRPDDIARWRILRKSLDARSRHELEFVYSAVVDVPDEAHFLRLLRTNGDVQHFAPQAFDDPPPGSERYSTSGICAASSYLPIARILFSICK